MEENPQTEISSLVRTTCRSETHSESQFSMIFLNYNMPLSLSKHQLSMGQKLGMLFHPPSSEAGPYFVAFAEIGTHSIVQDSLESLTSPASVTGVLRLQSNMKQRNLNGSYVDLEGLLLMHTTQKLSDLLCAATEHGIPTSGDGVCMGGRLPFLSNRILVLRTWQMVSISRY